MKYFTIDHDMNRPMLNQINVPLNSEYGIGVRVIKDNEPVNLKMGELSVNGMSATSQVNGYNLYQLSSGNDTGTNTLDVAVQSGINVVGEVSAKAINSSTRPRSMPYSSESYLSDFISEPTRLKASDFNVLGTFTKLSTSTEWTETSTMIYCSPWRVSMTNGAGTYYVAQFNADGVREVGWYNGDLVKQGYEYLEVQPSWKFYFGNTTVAARTARELKATVQIDTHGVKAKFPLQVNVTDKGYFERRLENEQTII